MLFPDTSLITAMKSKVGVMRVKTKDCYVCNDPHEAFYRCRHEMLKDWVFLCGDCLANFKSKYEDTYKYGGT